MGQKGENLNVSNGFPLRLWAFDKFIAERKVR
jgi:hypothetical protein